MHERLALSRCERISIPLQRRDELLSPSWEQYLRWNWKLSLKGQKLDALQQRPEVNPAEDQLSIRISSSRHASFTRTQINQLERSALSLDSQDELSSNTLEKPRKIRLSKSKKSDCTSVSKTCPLGLEEEHLNLKLNSILSNLNAVLSA